MDHPCHRCGVAVEDGVPFCKQCGAPQIRVIGVESSPPPTEPPAETGLAWGQRPAALNLPRAPGIQWSQALLPALLGAFLAVFTMLIPVPTLGLGVAAGGFLCVALYRRRTQSQTISPLMGARLGAVAGGIAYVIIAVVTAVAILAFLRDAQVREAMLKTWQEWAVRYPSLQIQQLLEYAKSPEELAHIMEEGLVVMFPLFLIASSLGGAIGAAVLGRKNRY